MDQLISERPYIERKFAVAVNARLQEWGATLYDINVGDLYLDSTSDKAYRDQWITKRKELTQQVVGQTEKVLSVQISKRHFLLKILTIWQFFFGVILYFKKF